MNDVVENGLPINNIYLFSYLRSFFRLVGGRSFRFSRIIVDSSSTGVRGHMFARCGRRGIERRETRRGAGKASDPLAVSAGHLATNQFDTIYGLFLENDFNSFADGKLFKGSATLSLLATFSPGKLYSAQISLDSTLRICQLEDASSLLAALGANRTIYFLLFSINRILSRSSYLGAFWLALENA